MIEGKCELCEREVSALTKHHLLPREEGGKEEHIAMLCEACHRQIHAMYTNKELAVRLTDIQALKEDEAIAKYIKFIKKQTTSKKIKLKKSHNVRKRKS